jgi:hypothetical protein
MKNLTSLTAKEILKFKPTANEISQLGVVNGKAKTVQDVSLYFDGKNYFATKGKLFNVRQNHVVACKGSFDKVSNYILSLAN